MHEGRGGRDGDAVGGAGAVEQAAGEPDFRPRRSLCLPQPPPAAGRPVAQPPPGTVVALLHRVDGVLRPGDREQRLGSFRKALRAAAVHEAQAVEPHGGPSCEGGCLGKERGRYREPAHRRLHSLVCLCAVALHRKRLLLHLCSGTSLQRRVRVACFVRTSIRRVVPSATPHHCLQAQGPGIEFWGRVLGVFRVMEVQEGVNWCSMGETAVLGAQ